MKNVLEVVKQLQADSSRTGKEEILKQNQDNEELKEVLRFINDSFNLTGMTSKIMKKFIGKQFGVKLPVFETIFDVMKYVSVNNSSKHTDVLAVVNFIEKEEDEELKDLYYKIISKELKTGAARTMLNKVYGKDFVPKFEVLLAKKFEDHQHKVEGKEFVITEKLDGLRCILVVEDDSVKMFSRQGKPMQGFVEIEEYAQYLPNAVYDGEMLISNADNYTDRDVLQETMKVARKDGNKTGLTLHLFDMLPVDEFKDGKSKENFIARKEKLIDELHELRSPVITYVPNLYEGKDMSKIPGILSRMEDEGREGLMLNLSDGRWEGKRSDKLLKIKTMETADLLVTGIEEGTGRLEGKLGALVLDYKGFELRCGVGFSDHEREVMYQFPEQYIGRVVEVQYFRESTNQKGGLSISFPVYKMIREKDKEVSYH